MFKVVEFKANGTSYFIEKSISLIDCWNKSKHLICVEDLKQLVFIPKLFNKNILFYTEISDQTQMYNELIECVKNLNYQIPKNGRLNMPMRPTESFISVCNDMKISVIHSWTHFWMIYYLHCLYEEREIKRKCQYDEIIMDELETNSHYCCIEEIIDHSYYTNTIPELSVYSIISTRELCIYCNKIYKIFE